VVVVGLGSRQNALAFSKVLGFPLRLLYAGEPSSLPQSFCVEKLHQQLSTPASYPTVAAWPATTLHYHENHSIGLSALQSQRFFCKRPQVLQYLNGTATLHNVCVFALLQIQKECATRLLASHLDLLLTLRYLRTSSCCPC